MIEINKLRKGFCEEAELSFSEIAFSSEKSKYWVVALNAGDIEFYFCSEKPLSSLAEELELTADWDFEITESGEEQDNGSSMQTLSLEELIGSLQESDLEHYECWRGDGGEQLSEMAESEHAKEFLITYHFNSLLESQNTAALNRQLEYYCEMVNESFDDLVKELELQ